MTDEIEFFSTTVLCVRGDGLVLGAARKDLHPTNWGLPGGKLDDGEDAIDAAIRETFEETGVSVVLDPVPLYWGPDTSSSGDLRYCVTYLATAYTGDPRQQEGEGQAAWVQWQDLLDGVFGGYNSALQRVWNRNPRKAENTRKVWQIEHIYGMQVVNTRPFSEDFVPAAYEPAETPEVAVPESLGGEYVLGPVTYVGKLPERTLSDIDVTERHPYRTVVGLTDDDKHRARCRERLGHGRCICADYAAVTALLHPDCPQHGYVTSRDHTPT